MGQPLQIAQRAICLVWRSPGSHHSDESVAKVDRARQALRMASPREYASSPSPYWLARCPAILRPPTDPRNARFAA